jgi:hypothetical protein
MRVATAGVLGRSSEELAGVPILARFSVMLGDHPEEVVGAGTGLGREPCGCPGVVLPTESLEHRVVGDLMQQLVPEGVLAHVFETGLRVPVHQLAAG